MERKGTEPGAGPAGPGGRRDWLKEIQLELERGGLLRGVRRLLAAVSGGPDSTALLLLLAGVRETLEAGAFPELLAGHVHHGLRGAEADEDERFVRELASSLGIACLVERGDARAEAARRGLSPEAAARALRYRAFDLWARERGIDAIALAHHLDDQAETVLFRAIRGGGVRGLGGMARERLLTTPAEGGRGGRPRGTEARIIRPLLAWRRSSLIEFLEERGQATRMDASNRDLSVPRNRIRHDVLPLLEGIQPGAALSLARLGRIAAGLARDLDLLGERALREALASDPSSDGVLLRVESLRAWPPSILYEVFRRAVRKISSSGREGGEGAPGAGDLSGRAFRVLRRWVGARWVGPARLEIGGAAPDGGRVLIELRYGLIRVTRSAGEETGETPPTPLVPGGPVVWRDWTFSAGEAPAGSRERLAGGTPPPRDDGEEHRRDDDDMEELFDADSLGAAGPLAIRSRRVGDAFHPLGGPGRKPLKEFFRERRVWPSDRVRVPLLVAGEAIAWVVGHRIAHPFRVREDTRRVLGVRARRAAREKRTL